ncbi:RibD family protein [Elioraea rosea]|uniref:RibD family protein n=1 Tax=Elioraea rosea TaxID=2492390 RepID=UPI001EF49248|nr:RibD family protein [Elioraea rosea]
MGNLVRGADAAVMWEALLRRRGGKAGPLPVPADAEAAQLAALLGPVTAPPVAPDGMWVTAHLAQSLDGRIATRSGVSQWISDRADIIHTHRLRALHHAILVGAGTIAADDPQLTTREVKGETPVRIVLDTERRLSPAYRVFSGGAPTLLVCAADVAGPQRHGEAEVVRLPRDASGRLDLALLLRRLWQRGLTHLFVEGGGVTVGRFLAAGLLDRLHVAVAPLLIGSGLSALVLPEATRPEDGLRAEAKTYTLGADTLFDLALARARPACAR